MQLGWGHSNPRGCVHRVLGTESFQKAFDAPHCLRAAARGNPGISYLADSPATCQEPCGHHHGLCAHEQPQPQAAWRDTRGKHHACELLGITAISGSKQSRSEILPCLMLAGRWREMEADAGRSSRNELVLCPLLPAALDPMDRSLELCQKALSCIHLQEGPFQFPRRLLLCRGCLVDASSLSHSLLSLSLHVLSHSSPLKLNSSFLLSSHVEIVLHPLSFS